MSKSIEELEALGKRLGKDGYPTATIERAAARMDALEKEVLRQKGLLTISIAIIEEELMPNIGGIVSDIGRLNTFLLESAK